MNRIDIDKLDFLNEKAKSLEVGCSFSVSVDFIQQCFNTTWSDSTPRYSWLENFERWALANRLKISHPDSYTFIVSA